ncbi:MAG: efflux RND transporter periplasmic adaptor subunit [Parachlamydiaceae bacterium]
MNVNLDRTLLCALCLLAGLLLLAGCHRNPPKLQLPPPTVTVMTVKQQTIPAIFEYVGVVQSSHLVEIRARVEGYLDKIGYIEGTLVHEGDLLFEIDPKPFEAALAQAKGGKAQQEAALWDAQQTVNRLKPLYEKNAASKRDLDNAVAQQLGAQASLESAQAQVRQAELNLGYTTIHSPITGLTGQAQFREGALVSPGPNGLLTTVSAMNPIWVNFNISSGDILKYEKESAKGLLVFPDGFNFDVEVILADGTILPSKGKVDFADPSLKESTGSMSVRAVLPNPMNILKPGQFVRARVIGAVHPNAIIVPQVSVMQGKSGLFVYVLDTENKVVMRQVEVGDWYLDNWIVDSGLNVGDRVIVDGVNKVIQGSTVIFREADSHGKGT